jgi:glutaconyl-CoA/methylmalonyl-CoA decarboxylase subunit gamma
MKLRITIHGVSYDVDVEVLDAGEGFPKHLAGPLPEVTSNSQPGSTAAVPADMASAPGPAPKTAVDPPVQPDGGTIASPIAGNVLEIKCREGDAVTKDQVLLVIEAMKMETSIAAPAPGTVKSIDVGIGDAVREGQTLIRFS